MTGDPHLPNQNIEQLVAQNLEYGRDLFVHLFQDDTPLVNLGYTSKQRTVTRRVLTAMENEGRVIATPKPWVHFTNVYEDEVSISLTKFGAYTLDGAVDSKIPGSTAEERVDNIVYWLFKEEPSYFPEDDWKVADLALIPSHQDTEDINGLIHLLYEGTEGSQWNIRLKKKTPVNALTGTILPTRFAVYEAGWVDERTKLELVVRTDFQSKSADPVDANKEIHVWRKLPQLELEGKSWIPFGRKPTISEDRMRQILEANKQQSVIGKLVTRTQQI